MGNTPSSGQPSVSPAPTLPPALGGATSAPTAFIDPFLVYVTEVAQNSGNNYFDGGLAVTNAIGFKITDDPTVQLFDKDCVNLAAAGDLVSVSGETFTDGSGATDQGTNAYTLNIDQAKIGADVATGTYVECDITDPGSGCSIGNIKFCTRVSSFVGSVEVAFRETNFDLGFNLTDNVITLASVGIEENVPDSFITDVDTAYSVNACPCDDSFTCVSASAVAQDTPLVMCIHPLHADQENAAAENVKITNFNVNIKPTGDTDPNFDAVTFGTDSWVASELVSVETDDDDFKIKITTPIIAQFYIQNIATVDVTGNAFLEFVSGKGGAPIFGDIAMEVGLAGVGGYEYGCLSGLIQKFRALM